MMTFTVWAENGLSEYAADRFEVVEGHLTLLQMLPKPPSAHNPLGQGEEEVIIATWASGVWKSVERAEVSE